MSPRLGSTLAVEVSPSLKPRDVRPFPSIMSVVGCANMICYKQAPRKTRDDLMHLTTLNRPINARSSLGIYEDDLERAVRGNAQASARAPALVRAVTLAIGVLALSTALAETPQAAPAPPSPPPAEVGSYDLGLMLGNQLANSGFGTGGSRKDLMRGIDDALAGKVPTTEQREAVSRFSRSNRAALAASNAKLAAEFLARNAHAPGITSMPSGLQYQVLAAGVPQQAPPAPTDEVTLRYHLSLADGTVLDRSEDHTQGQPVFRVNAVIPAWREALLAMRPGASWRLFVPPDLGYGANPPPPIPPGALLVFDLELMGVERAPQGLQRKPETASPPSTVRPKSPE